MHTLCYCYIYLCVYKTHVFFYYKTYFYKILFKFYSKIINLYFFKKLNYLSDTQSAIRESHKFSKYSISPKCFLRYIKYNRKSRFSLIMRSIYLISLAIQSVWEHIIDRRDNGFHQRNILFFSCDIFLSQPIFSWEVINE